MHLYKTIPGTYLYNAVFGSGYLYEYYITVCSRVVLYVVY